MIDTKELRRLAQAATPHVGHACKYQDAHWLREGHVDFENADLFIASERPQEDAEFYAAANPVVINELLDRLEAAEEDRSNFIVEMGKLCAQCDALRARIEAMERQEPVGRALLCVRCSTPFDGEHYCPACGHHTATEEAVYAIPGAQPAPTRNNPSHIHQGGAGSDQGDSDQQQVAAA